MGAAQCPGGRYLGSFSARKNGAGSASVRMQVVHRLHQGLPTHQKTGTPTESASYSPGSSMDSAPPFRVDLPGDLQASFPAPAIYSLKFYADSGSESVSVDKLQLLRLSTCLEYDGENLREICTPDGARHRTEMDRSGRPSTLVSE